ncbi:DUF6714 family protein [Trichocoleus sp. FACHB-262]|uniref:DUF6714 family protein n=1 Tax=Trichocoleus sp. FACHB-262 TaxID=2692869 RepID=UPI001688340C|nr:DUF6714 family protein [Trichocoleus sp. FACHB-262]MBD2121812.1 hypothetical protein [Trichocoleus sp. FACHB-262]
MMRKLIAAVQLQRYPTKPMPNSEAVKLQIRSAFASVQFPGDWCLRGSNEGDEPFLLEQEFKGKTDWQALDPAFIDRAPDGFGSALSFFSDEAFRFYLPAYLITDIDGKLDMHDPVFHLTHGLTDETRGQRVNPRRYGERTWFDEQGHRFAVFDREQARAIVSYLELKRETDEFQRDEIDQAIANYWSGRAEASAG